MKIEKKNKVIKASKAKKREIKRMMMKIDININWRTHLIFKKASVKIKVRREKKRGGKKKANRSPTTSLLLTRAASL